MLGVCFLSPQGAIFVSVCLQACASLLWVCILYKPGSWCVLCDRRRRYFGGRISPLPSTQDFVCFYFLMISSVFFTRCVFHVFTLFDLCYGKVLSAFMTLSACARGWQDWSDGLSRHWRLILWGFDSRSAPLYFARPPLAAFSFVSPPHWSDQDVTRRGSRFGEQSSGFYLFWIFIYLF